MDDSASGEQLKAGLRRLSEVVRELLAEPSLDSLLARLVDTAKELTGADFSALLLVRDGSDDEVTQFVYNAPRQLFPEHLPRAVGLLAVPIRTCAPVRIDDIRGHPDGVGIPVEHPPIAGLLAVPVLAEGRVVGELAVANGAGGPTFGEVDEALLTELSAHAGVAVAVATARQARARADEARRAVLDVALHNLRTPLTVAKGFLATIKAHGDRLGPEERQRAFEAIERAHDRILELAEGALLSEPAVTERSPASDTVDVPTLLAELASGVVDGTTEIAVDVVVDDETPRSFTGDRRLARELLENLVTNAVKHSGPGQTVTLTVRPEGRSVRFDVTDQGPGIPPEEQSRVFEQFYRTRQSVAEGVPGSGLGLWIARRLAELQGGTVGVSSRAGQGTTVWATFPLERPAAGEPGAG